MTFLHNKTNLLTLEESRNWVFISNVYNRGPTNISLLWITVAVRPWRCHRAAGIVFSVLNKYPNTDFNLTRLSSLSSMSHASTEPKDRCLNLNKCNSTYTTALSILALKLIKRSFPIAASPRELFSAVTCRGVSFAVQLGTCQHVNFEPAVCDHVHLHKKRHRCVHRFRLSFDPVCLSEVVSSVHFVTALTPDQHTQTHTHKHLLLHQRSLQRLINTLCHSTAWLCCPSVPAPQTYTCCGPPLRSRSSYIPKYQHLWHAAFSSPRWRKGARWG